MINLAGIYEVRNILNGVRYIGSSQCIKERLQQHKRMLAKGNHHSIALQRAWDKYGSEAFAFSPLVVLEDAELLSTEQRFLDAEHSGETYNIAKDAVAWMKGRKHTDEWHEKAKEWRKGNKSRTGVPSHWVGQSLSETFRKALTTDKTDAHKNAISTAKKGIKPTRGDLCIRGHDLTGDNVYTSPGRGMRTCKICIKIRYENHQLKLKESRGTQNSVT